jgi:two-component system, OmpR family, response regulator
MRLLIAEDDARIAGALATALEASGFAVEQVGDGEDAWFKGDSEDFDLIVLDLGLPKMDGLTALKRWRKAGRSVPVLVLTARGNWDERVDGIEAGADDYVVKPFRTEEVVARVRAILRRAGGRASPRMEIGNVSLDPRTKVVTREGVEVRLTPLEYRLLHYLMHHNGQVISQLAITEHLYAQDFDRDSNSVEVLVGRLRKKLGNDVIRTRRGFGYYIGEETS